jgi:HEAT repeat protein
MSSSRLFFIALCLLGAVLPVRAQKPGDSRNSSSSQRSEVETGFTKEVGGKTLDEWRKDLIHGDASVRADAIRAIVHFQQAAELVPDIVNTLKRDNDAEVRVKAAQALRWIRTSPTHRTRVIQALGHAVSNDSQSIIRYEAAHTLCYCFCPLNLEVKEERDVLQDLVKGLRDRSTYALRDICAQTLIYAGVDPKNGPDPRVTEALVQLANPNYELTTQVRLKAIMALGRMGRPPDPKRLASVLSILKTPANYNSQRPRVRIWSHVAIIALEEKINKKDLDTIAGYLKHREAAIKAEAILALGALEDKAQDYVRNICEALLNEKDTKDFSVRQAAAQALGNMKNKGPQVVSALIDLTELDSRDSIGVVLSACFSLKRLGANDGQTMKALDKVLAHKSLGGDEKKMIEKIIDEIKNPPRKPVKAAANDPAKGVANPNQRKR